MSQPTLTLALTTKASKKITPPLRKSELVEALARREMQNISEEQALIRKQIAEINKQVFTAANAELIRATGRLVKEYSGLPFDINNVNGAPVSIDLTVELPIPPEMAKLLRKRADLEKRQLHSHNTPSLHDLKRNIRAKMEGQTVGSDRVSLLLKDPATIRALDATIAELKKPQFVALPVAV